MWDSTRENPKWNELTREEKQRRLEQRKAAREAIGSIPPGFWYMLILLLGLIMVGFGIFQSYQFAASRRWTSVSGQIIESRVHTYTVTESSRSGSRTITYHEPIIRYVYTFQGQRYEGNRVKLSEQMCIFSLCTSDQRKSESRDPAQAKVALYPTNATVTVLVDPAHPQTAILERNISPFILFSLGMGLVMVLIGVGLIWISTHPSPQPDEDPYFRLVSK